MPTHHVIIGGGPAATNAIETIRQLEQDTSQITLVSDEPAHSRMALPYWLAGQIPRQQTSTGDDAYFAGLQVDTRFGVRATRLDVASSRLELSDGSQLSFDDLLIATGSSPLHPPIPGADLPGVQPLWTLDHTARVLEAAAGLDKPHVVLVGAGFIGFIVLGAMFKRSWRLSVVEQQQQVLPRMLDAEAAGIVQQWLGSLDVDVHPGATVSQITQANGKKVVQLDNGTQLEADIVILATGVRPNVELAREAGIEIDEGIVVDDRMQTSVASVYAAGDVAQGPVLASDRREIHAIQPTAVDHGRVAGANMAGRQVHYPGSLRMNVVDVCGLQAASFGQWDAADAEAMTIANASSYIYRKLLWRDDQLVGAIFLGRANDMGMLTDVGMVKGILQTQTPLGAWKRYLAENPFDIRRPYVGAGVAQKLVGTTLLGQPTQARRYHYGGAVPSVPANPAHQVWVETKAE